MCLYYTKLGLDFKNCLAIAHDNYKCYGSDGLEWANWNEDDGTHDNSILTSIETDGLLETSPSINVRGSFKEKSYIYDYSPYTSVETSHTSQS